MSKYPRDALEHLKCADKYDGNSENPGILDAIGQAYHQLCNYDDAITFYKDAIKLDVTNVDFYCNIARCFYDMEKYALAAENLDEALKVNDKNSKVHY